LKLPGKAVVWPTNIDSTKSRKEGRKIGKGQGVQNPRLDELIQAAKQLSLEPETQPMKAKPSLWWEKGGYVIVRRNEQKLRILRTLASEIKKIRASKTTHEKERK